MARKTHCLVLCWAFALSLSSPRRSRAEDTYTKGAPEPPAPSRPLHFLAQAGTYAALGGPAPWGTVLAVDLLPGSFAGRYGFRGEWRGYRKSSTGSVIGALLFEAGASRPQLALKLLIQAGATSDARPIIGAGIEWSLWLWGPLGVSTLTDLQLVIDGTKTRPVLSANLSFHLGR